MQSVMTDHVNTMLEMVLYSLTNEVLWGPPARIASVVRVKLGGGLQARRGDGVGTGHGYFTGQEALSKKTKARVYEMEKLQKQREFMSEF